MQSGLIPKRITRVLLLAVSLLAGCTDAPQFVSKSSVTPAATSDTPAAKSDTPAATSDGDDLPKWLQEGPADWGDEVWRVYQASLIESRAAMLRTQAYSADELQVRTAEVEHWPGEYEDKIKDEWLKKWRSRIQFYELTGGCGCCNEIFTVTGPMAAIEEFPTTSNRREYYPKYLAHPRVVAPKGFP